MDLFSDDLFETIHNELEAMFRKLQTSQAATPLAAAAPAPDGIKSKPSPEPVKAKEAQKAAPVPNITYNTVDWRTVTYPKCDLSGASRQFECTLDLPGHTLSDIKVKESSVIVVSHRMNPFQFPGAVVEDDHAYGKHENVVISPFDLDPRTATYEFKNGVLTFAASELTPEIKNAPVSVIKR
jgi:HSP20 family molecular chaperone IbpA